MHRAPSIGLVLFTLLLVLGGCAGRDRLARPDDVGMTLVYLETGPRSAANTPEQKREIFQGHMENMQRLAHEGRLLIAGPFSKPHNTAWRGIFVFDVADVAAANALAATDPGVVGGEFKAVVKPIIASASPRESLRLENQMQEELKAQGAPERKPGEPPPGLRPYAIMHAEDIARAWTNLKSSTAAPDVIWWARFKDGADGVVVLDAKDAATAEAALKNVDLGPHVIDGWFSTKALERLPNETKE